MQTSPHPSGLKLVYSGLARSFLPPAKLDVADWADSNRRLTSVASAEAGQWRTSRAEYQRGILNAVSDPHIHTVVVKAASQSGKTEVLLNAIGYHIDHDPAPMLAVQPNVSPMAEAFSKDRVAQMVAASPCLKDKFGPAKARHSGDTILHKAFPGGHITFAGANTPASLASRPIRILLFDEIDRYPLTAGREGDPIRLAIQRATTFWNRLILMVSSPTNKGHSRIEAEYLKTDQRRFFVPCQHCGNQAYLEWEQVQWPDGEPEKAALYCDACGAEWSEADRAKAVAKGEWRPTAEKPVKGRAGFWFSALYSPWVSITELAMEYEECKDRPFENKVFTNTKLARTYSLAENLDVTAKQLRSRKTSLPRGELPKHAALVTAGVDVQGDRLEVQLVAWGSEDEKWTLEHHIIWGDPTSSAPYIALEEYLDQVFTHPSGKTFYIEAVAMDSGGHATQHVYNWAREAKKKKRRWYAIKGIAGQGKLVWNQSRARIKGMKLFLVGTDSAKETLVGDLAISGPGPGYHHFADSLPDDWFDQLLAEELMVEADKLGREKRAWRLKQEGARNEALDTLVYAYAAALSLKIDIARRLNLINGVTAQAKPATPDEPPKPKRSRSGWLGAA